MQKKIALTTWDDMKMPWPKHGWTVEHKSGLGGKVLGASDKFVNVELGTYIPKKDFRRMHISDVQYEGGKKYAIYAGDGFERGDWRLYDNKGELVEPKRGAEMKETRDENEEPLFFYIEDGANKAVIEIEKSGGKWTESVKEEIEGELYGIGGKTYQSYLTADDIESWLNKDYDHVERIEEDDIENYKSGSVGELEETTSQVNAYKKLLDVFVKDSESHGRDLTVAEFSSWIEEHQAKSDGAPKSLDDYIAEKEAETKEASSIDIAFTISGGGDPSVGIADVNSDIEIKIKDNLIDVDVEELTEWLRDFFAEYYDIQKKEVRTKKEYEEELEKEREEEPEGEPKIKELEKKEEE